MRDDLLDAQAAIDWAVTQIELLQQALIEWQQRHPYRIVKERDPKSGDYLVIAVEDKPLPLTMNAWVGAILNSLRSSLDLLAAALAARNGEKTNRYRHFPIFDCLHDMIDPVRGIDSAERKKWLSQSERAMIKRLKPYKGGDDTIWSLHELDIVRKHERLIFAKPGIDGALILGSARMTIFGTRAVERLDDKTILARLSPSENFAASEGNVFPAISISFNETALGLADEDVLPALRKFATRVAEIVKRFDS
jgi:hypothetical protein